MFATSRRQQVCRAELSVLEDPTTKTCHMLPLLEAMDHCRNLMDLLDRDNARTSALPINAALHIHVQFVLMA